MLKRTFHLEKEKTSVSKEFIAALTTFMAISYVIFVIPNLLSQTGMDYNAVYGATVFASAIATLLVGLIANVPYAMSAGIGIASLITYTICGSLGYTWEQSLAMLFICGIINIIITFTNLRKMIIKAIPVFLQDAITVGIGLFITYVGLINSKFIVFKASSIENGIAANVVPEIANFSNISVILAIICLIIATILSVKKVRGAYLISIVLTTLIGIPLGVTTLPDFSNYRVIPSISPTFLHLDFIGLFSVKTGIIVVLMTIFTLCISEVFDTIGVFIGTGKKSGIFKMNENGEIPKKLEKALFADSFGTIIAALLGTSNVTTYVESSAGIEAGGRTGLTSVFISIFFLLTLLLSPIIACVPIEAVSPILILIGVSMFQNVKVIDFSNIKIAIPAFLTIIMMPLSYSITTGIEFGFISYVIIDIFSKDKEKVSPIIYIFAILFIIKYIFQMM